jgi:hypothetical protein
MAGLTCVVCGDEQGGSFGGPVDEPDALDDTKKKKKKLKQTKNEITISDTDVIIPLLFGSVVVYGNILEIYKTDPTHVSMLIAIGEGPIEGITRAWIGNQLVIDNTSSGLTRSAAAKKEKLNIKIFKGGPNQKVENRGRFGEDVAMRGIAYMRVENYPLLGTQGRIPEIRVEIASKVSKAISTYYQSTHSSADLWYDLPGGYLFSYSGPTVRISDSSFTSLTTFNSDANITRFNVTKDYNDIILQTATNKLHFISGVDKTDVQTVTAPLAYSAVFGGRVRTSDPGLTRYIVGVNGATVDFYESRKPNYTTLTLSGSFTHPEAIHTFILAEFSSSSYERDTLGFAFSNNNTAPGFLRVSRSRLYSPFSKQDLGLGTPDEFNVPLRGILQRVVHIPQENAFLIYSLDGPEYVVTKIGHSDPTVKIYEVPVPEIPQSSGRQEVTPVGETYSFIKGGKVYTTQLSSGVTYVEYDLVENGATLESSGGFFDGLTNSVFYLDVMGKISKILPDRFSAAPVSLKNVVDSILERAFLPPELFDTSGLSGVTLDGYRIDGQLTAEACLSELSRFYHLNVVESSKGITIRPRSLSPVSTVDEPSFRISGNYGKLLQEQELAEFVSITYFDRNREFSTMTQTVTKDLINGKEVTDSIKGGESYEINLYTTASVVRLSAEMRLLKNNEKPLGGVLVFGPRYLAIEPGDFITGSREQHYCYKAYVDVDFSMRFDLSKDDRSKYEESPALSGVIYNPLVASISTPGGVKNYPVSLPLIPARYKDPRVIHYTGQVSPHYSYERQLSLTLLPSGQTRRVSAEPTSETQHGVLESYSGITRINEFSYDELNTFVVRFAKPVVGLTVASREELNASLTRNLLFIGTELVQFTSFSIGGDTRTVTFSGLYRGRMGTVYETERHFVQEPVYLYESSALSMSEIGAPSEQYGNADLILPSLLDNSIRRRASTHIKPLGTPDWLNTTLSARNRWGAFALRGIDFDILRNRVYDQELFNGIPGQLLSSVARLPRFFSLKAPYNAALFQAALLEGNYLFGTLSGPSPGGSPNSYIHRELFQRERDPSSFTVYYRREDMVGDGLGENSEIYFATYSDKIENARGYTLEAKVNRGFNIPTKLKWNP